MKLKEKVMYVSKVITIVAIAIIVLAAACAAALTNGKEIVKAQDSKRMGNYYALIALVVEIDRENDTMTCMDNAGNAWQFYGAEDWQEGDCASLLIWDNGTESVIDDEIHSARYSTWGLMR